MIYATNFVSKSYLTSALRMRSRRQVPVLTCVPRGGVLSTSAASSAKLPGNIYSTHMLFSQLHRTLQVDSASEVFPTWHLIQRKSAALSALGTQAPRKARSRASAIVIIDTALTHNVTQLTMASPCIRYRSRERQHPECRSHHDRRPRFRIP